ncbi:hypothetical protein C5167_021670 [Papaver somniferum]|uniref:desiccation protectant protein Lea14 homolog n=1 Tax=Papaver somniferum TaxID=3469 RepID=UPI000E6F9514|nr:desiccation protectant protein Lea14 homolog [Papaver somniferum]RZC93381.1 hypothetical protein C5167_021670 [Papaver somniferum]
MADLFDKAKHFVTDTIDSFKKVPEATLTDVDVKSVGFTSVTLLAKISVNNPYITPLPMVEVDYTLKSHANVILTGKVPDPGNLKASGITLLEVDVKVPYSILLSVAKDVSTDWDLDYELLLGLIIDLPLIGNITIPLSQKGEFKLPSITDFFKGGGGEETKEGEEKEKETVSTSEVGVQKDDKSKVVVRHVEEVDEVIHIYADGTKKSED